MGRSAIFINEELLLDYGIKPTDPPTYPINGLRPKALVLSHGHLDHCGLAPNLMDLNPKIYSTSITAKLCALLARDTLKIAENKGHVIPYYSEEIQEFERRAKAVGYRQEFEASGYQVSLYDSGHIPGSSSVYVTKGNESLFYTGDINTLQTELLPGADTDTPQSDVLMIESTYFGRNHTPRKILEERFINSVRETVDIGGKAVIAAFSVGRTQEMMLLLRKHGIQAYVDGMGVDVFNIIKRSPEYVRDIRKLEKAFTNSSIVKPEQRREIIQEPSVIVTSAGMLNGGPVLYYINQIYDDPKSKIHLTGYQMEGTNGRRALESGYIEDRNEVIRLNCRLSLYDFSAHCGDEQLKGIVQRFCDSGTQTVLPVHGDDTEGFANWIKEEVGVDSKAPIDGETIRIQP